MALLGLGVSLGIPNFHVWFELPVLLQYTLALKVHVGDTHADFEVFVAVFGNLSIPLYGVGSHAIVDASKS